MLEEAEEFIRETHQQMTKGFFFKEIAVIGGGMVGALRLAGWSRGTPHLPLNNVAWV